LCLKGHIGVFPAPSDGFRSKGQVGNKISVHDIELNTMASGIFQLLAVFAELSEIGWQHGGDDLYAEEIRQGQKSEKVILTIFVIFLSLQQLAQHNGSHLNFPRSTVDIQRGGTSTVGTRNRL
jgi:hypothetical protein